MKAGTGQKGSISVKKMSKKWDTMDKHQYNILDLKPKNKYTFINTLLPYYWNGTQWPGMATSH